MTDAPVHLPILTAVILDLLNLTPGARCIDATIDGGGHTAALVTQLGMASKVDHVSTGGGALISHLGGEPMPVLEALAQSKKLHLEGRIKHRRA